MKNKQNPQNKRILSRILARELSKEELGLVEGGNATGPGLSTLVATLPDYSEDQ